MCTLFENYFARILYKIIANLLCITTVYPSIVYFETTAIYNGMYVTWAHATSTVGFGAINSPSSRVGCANNILPKVGFLGYIDFGSMVHIGNAFAPV
jgi:hypothetical protein